MEEDKIIVAYKDQIDLYKKLKDNVDSLLRNLCNGSLIQIHSISSRIKTEDSLKGKIANRSEEYNSISEITDIVGVRIITLFEDDVQKISNIIKPKFKVDPEKSEDKFKRLKTNEFGYRSVHFICNMKFDRNAPPEYKDISSIKFEIQIRSILQHSWAEIEHDLGYKSEYDLPEDIQRDFFRVAGLLELADMKFLRIKREIKNYSDEININDKTKHIPINLVSLSKFFKQSKILNEIESTIAILNNIPIKGEFADSKMLKILFFLKIDDFNKLELILIKEKEKLIKFTSLWIKGQNLLRKGLGIWTLAYIIKAEEGDEKLEEYLKKMDIGEKQYSATNSKRIYDTLQKVKSQ